MDKTGTSTTIVVAVALIALLAGFGGAKLLDKSNTSSTTATTSTAVPMAMPSMAPDSGTKSGDLRATLVQYGVQHMDLTSQAVDAALDGNANAGEMKNELIANGTNLSAKIGSVYGADAQAAFQKIWNIHLVDFVNYAVAGKKGDAAGKATALADISTNYTKPISVLLSGANPNLPEATLETAFGDHITMTAAMIDDHVAGKYPQETIDREAAIKHINDLMSTLTGAIVKQYPAKF